jgi:hypothetical protein
MLRNLIEKNAFEEVYDIYYLYNSESQKNWKNKPNIHLKSNLQSSQSFFS